MGFPKSFKQINICNLYLLLWAVYALHWSDSMIPIVEAISNIILGFNMIISIYYAGIALYKYKLPPMFKGINILLILFTIYGLQYIVFGPDRYHLGAVVGKGTYLVSALRSFLPIYVFYVFTRRGLLTRKTAAFWSLVFLGTFLICYSRSLTLWQMKYGVSEFVNNTGYLFAIAIPSIYFFRKKLWIQIIIISICFSIVVISLKRGAILIAGIEILIFAYEKLKAASPNRKVLVLIGIFCVGLVGVLFVQERISQSQALSKRIEKTKDGNLSNRDVLWHDFEYYYKYKASFFQQVFGSGGDATLSVSNNWAHNDWWEILICQGVIGIAGYIFFWIMFWIQWKRTRNRLAKSILLSYMIAYFLRTLFSMSYSMIFSIATMSIGYALAIEDMSRRENLLLKYRYFKSIR